MSEKLSAYQFTGQRFVENDGSATLSLNEIDLVENGKNEQEARLLLGQSILDYSADYYNDYENMSRSPNRKNHIPYIFKALITDAPAQIGDMIECRDGEN